MNRHKSAERDRHDQEIRRMQDSVATTQRELEQARKLAEDERLAVELQRREAQARDRQEEQMRQAGQASVVAAQRENEQQAEELKRALAEANRKNEAAAQAEQERTRQEEVTRAEQERQTATTVRSWKGSIQFGSGQEIGVAGDPAPIVDSPILTLGDRIGEHSAKVWATRANFDMTITTFTNHDMSRPVYYWVDVDPAWIGYNGTHFYGLYARLRSNGIDVTDGDRMESGMKVDSRCPIGRTFHLRSPDGVVEFSAVVTNASYIQEITNGVSMQSATSYELQYEIAVTYPSCALSEDGGVEH